MLKKLPSIFRKKSEIKKDVSKVIKDFKINKVPDEQCGIVMIDDIDDLKTHCEDVDKLLYDVLDIAINSEGVITKDNVVKKWSDILPSNINEIYEFLKNKYLN